MNENFDQLGNKISIVPLRDVQSISGNNFILSTYQNLRSYFTMNDLNLDQKSNPTDAGDLYLQNLTAIVKKNDELLRFRGQDLMIILYSLKDKTFVWGSKEFPVKCKITPQVSTFSVELTRSSPFPLEF